MSGPRQAIGESVEVDLSSTVFVDRDCNDRQSSIRSVKQPCEPLNVGLRDAFYTIREALTVCFSGKQL
jgi:hypothetical protein